jgi:hypothetical protein
VAKRPTSSDTLRAVAVTMAREVLAGAGQTGPNTVDPDYTITTRGPVNSDGMTP